MPGVHLLAVRLAVRPGFEVSLLVEEQAQDRLLEALVWFRNAATAMSSRGRGPVEAATDQGRQSSPLSRERPT